MEKRVNLFWWYWLLVVTDGVILFGLAFILLPDVMKAFFNWLLFSSTHVDTQFSPEAVSYQSFVYGVLGAVMVGWGVALFLMIFNFWRRGEFVSWYSLATSIFIWYVIDSGFSISKGYVENTISNTVFFVLYAIPLAATYKAFARSRHLERADKSSFVTEVK
jgi:multisubunit Na+/H+ antiporter MnhE subunit